MKPTIGAIDGHGKQLFIDLPRLLLTRMLLQADSGGGKTVALKRILEQTHGHVQQIVIDPEGEFSTLREKFDYLLCAPEGADAIANPKTAPILARKLRETRVSAVVDIYDLRPQEQKHFVKLFIEELLAAPKSLWHPCLLIIDEAQVFAPENDKAESLGAIMDLRGRGRKRGLCPILATPRLAELSKDACAGLQNKLIGVTTLDLDVKRAARDLALTPMEATTLLRNLEPGEFFCFGPALTRKITKVKIGPIKTSHGQHTVGKNTRPPAPSEKIKDVIAKLTDLPKEAEHEARTLAEIKAENASLKRELTLAKKNTDPAAIAQAVKQERQKIEQEIKTSNLKLLRQYDRLKAFAEEAMKFIVKITADEALLKEGVDPETIEKAAKKAVDEIRKQINARFESQRRLLENYRRQGARLFKDMEAFLEGARVPVDVSIAKQESVAVSVKPQTQPLAKAVSTSGNGTLGSGERKVLTAIAQHQDGVTREQITVLTGYKRSSRDTYLQRLRQAEFISLNGERIYATDAGIDALGGGFAPLPTGAELRDYWLTKLPEGERKLLEVLVNRYPDWVEREMLSDATGYKRSSRDTYLQRLRSRELIETSGSAVRASERLFA